MFIEKIYPRFNSYPEYLEVLSASPFSSHSHSLCSLLNNTICKSSFLNSHNYLRTPGNFWRCFKIQYSTPFPGKRRYLAEAAKLIQYPSPWEHNRRAVGDPKNELQPEPGPIADGSELQRPRNPCHH